TIALRAGRNLQLYNCEKKQKLKAHVMDEDVIFWNHRHIVTERCVLHWRLGQRFGPSISSLAAGARLSTYKCDSTEKWLVLVGIAAQQGPGCGRHAALYSVDRRVSQPLEGHAAAFARLKPSTNQASQVNVFCFSVRSGGAAASCTPSRSASSAALRALRQEAVGPVLPGRDRGRFPVAMQTSDRLGLAYVVTKFGYIHVYDLETATSIYLNRISDETIFVTAPYELTGGIIGVNRCLSVSIDEDQPADCRTVLIGVMRNDQLALALAARCDLPEPAEIVRQRSFQDFWTPRSTLRPPGVARRHPEASLRTAGDISKQPARPPASVAACLQYFSCTAGLGRSHKVNRWSSCARCCQQGASSWREVAQRGQARVLEGLGDLARP
uniref:Clathrin heavy chain n=1 Tax=Macrostomum lignano TaxID=282301 RepID=A0A1I8FD19_9PLAT